MSKPLAMVLGALTLFGCPSKDEPKFDENDRAIAQLKAEKERLAHGGAPPAVPRPAVPHTPENDLAEAAAQPKAPQRLKVLEAQGAFGELTLTVKSAESSQNVKGTKTSLSTADRFVKVVLSAHAKARETIELGSVMLVREGEQAALARDVQRVGQGSPLGEIVIDANGDQELVMFFEAPASIVGPGMMLRFAEPKRTLDLPVL